MYLSQSAPQLRRYMAALSLRSLPTAARSLRLVLKEQVGVLVSKEVTAGKLKSSING